MKVLKLFFPAFAVFSSPQAPAVVCPGVVALAGRDKGVPKVWGCGHMGQPCLAQEELVIQNSLQGTKITSAGSGAPFGGQGAGRAVFSCQSGLKGFAIIKFPRAKGSRAGRITSAENPTWDLWSGHYFKKKSPYPKHLQKNIFHHGICTPVPLGLYFMGIPVISWHPAVPAARAGWDLGFQWSLQEEEAAFCSCLGPCCTWAPQAWPSLGGRRICATAPCPRGRGHSKLPSLGHPLSFPLANGPVLAPSEG